METRIRFCVVLDALGVFALICAALSLFSVSWLAAPSLPLFGWMFAAAVALFSLARICEIMRIILRAPNPASMRAARGAAAAGPDSPTTDIPRAA